MNPEPHPLVPWLTAERRSWLYRLVVALAPLAVIYGVVAEQDVAVWIGAVGAFLSTGTAALHTPTRIVQEPAEPDDQGQSVVLIAGVAAIVCLAILLAFDLIG